MAFVGWLNSGRFFVEEAYFRVVYFRVALCLSGIFLGGFFLGGFFGWHISYNHYFEAAAIETANNYSEGTKNIVRDIGRRSIEATGDQRETFWFIQKLSLAVQRGNVASIICGEREKQCYFES